MSLNSDQGIRHGPPPVS